MLSIGVLGFIVWSSLMASLLNKKIFYLIINNFILCWNISTLYNTFYSINLYNYNKLADYNVMLNNKLKSKILLFFNYSNKNVLISKIKYFLFSVKYIYYDYYNHNKYIHSIVSEILCENNLNFNIFRKAYLQYKGKEFSHNDKWITWFIGFTEGDGAILEYKERLIFVITQKDSKVLHQIRYVLGFGIVKDFKGFSRFIVSNNFNCFLLYILFNGNLAIFSRINQLNRWYILLLSLKRLNIFKKFGISVVPNRFLLNQV